MPLLNSPMRLTALILTTLLLLGIVGCESRVTQENFNRVKIGMSLQEVHAILGEPSESSSFNLAGLSGTSSEWKRFDSSITIQFLNDQVTAKQFNKPKN